MKISSKGFTLIELMMAVTVVLTLVMVSAPIYERYLLKARMTEGPIALTQFYLAEREIFSEYGSYVACVFALGVTPEKRGYFVTGFQPTANLGKTPSIIPNCSAYVPQEPRVCPGQIIKEQECTINTFANSRMKESDYEIIPEVLLKRGSGATFNPYTDVSGATCKTTKLTDDSGTNGSSSLGPAPYDSYFIGYSRSDNHFTACTVAALATQSTGNNLPTEFTIDEQKNLKLLTQGF